MLYELAMVKDVAPFLDRRAVGGGSDAHEPDRGEIVLRSTFPAGGEDSIAGEAIVLPRNRWSCGNGRIEGFGLVRREVHVRRGGGFLCRESAI